MPTAPLRESRADTLPPDMQAWVATGYGAPDVLALQRLPLPQVGARDVLIRVEATTVSAGDRRLRAGDFPEGMGLLARAFCGITRLRRPVLGTELTGIVAAIGSAVTRFVPGNAVIAFSGAAVGGHAEYCRMAETGMIVPRPAGLPIETAAALGFGGTTAMDYLRRANCKAGEQVLVIGASGTVGSALVQLAAGLGARVSAVTSAGNHVLVRALGAGDVIDYAVRDVTTEPARWDIVADAVGALTFARALPILSEGGRYMSIAGRLGELLARPKGTRRSIGGPASEKVSDLADLTHMAVSGTFRPLIDSVLPFARMPEAHARADTGRKRGSVVVRLDHIQGQ